MSINFVGLPNQLRAARNVNRNSTSGLDEPLAARVDDAAALIGTWDYQKVGRMPTAA